MCGIAGEINFAAPPCERAISACTQALAHRGPDSGSLWHEGPAILGHRRLAILDVNKRSDQPMISPDGRYVIVFNGEIYNFRELRAELESQGERFTTTGDTEVLLRLHARNGASALSKLNGMFAFAIWDRERRTLFASRDRFGEKPFYYWVRPRNTGVVFASELRALIEHPDVPRRIDAKALGNYLANSYIVGPDAILSGVRRLPAAHWLELRPDNPPRTGQYWDLAAHYRDKQCFASTAEAEAALRDILEDSVRLRMISDVPLGAFLSGGVDSSIIVSSMVNHASREAVRTFSTGFAELGYSELPAAKRIACHLGVSFQANMISPALAADLPKIAASAGEPFADTSLVPTYYLAQHTRRHVTVALSGDGGDELFAGYETYLADRLHCYVAPLLAPVSPAIVWAAHALLPTSHGKVSLDYKVRQFASGLRLPFERAHWSWRNIFDECGRRRILRDPFDAAVASDGFEHVAEHFDAVRGCDPLDQAGYVDAKTWLVDGVLVKVDRATMAHSLESRAPFLDHRLAEFSARLPVRLKLHGRAKKYLLRKAFAGRLPDGTLDAPKQGFNAPVSRWVIADLRDLVQDVLASNVVTEIFKPGEIKRLYEEHLARKADHGQRLFNLFMFGLWRMSCSAST